MPLYEYLCESCGRKTEVIQRFSDPVLATCGHCGGPVKKLLSASAVQFKGSGWYVSDYGRAGGQEKNGKGKDKETESAKPAESGDKAVGAEAKPGAAEKPAEKKGAGGTPKSKPKGDARPAKGTPA